MEEKKNLEIVSGDGSNLEISPVYEHLNSAVPKDSSTKPKNVVIPKTSKDKEKDMDRKGKKEHQ